MPSPTANPRRSAQRAQIVAEAVVSAYILEIAPTERRHERARARARQSCTESSSTIARSPLALRGMSRLLAPRRRAALELGA